MLPFIFDKITRQSADKSERRRSADFSPEILPMRLHKKHLFALRQRDKISTKADNDNQHKAECYTEKGSEG